MITYSGVQMTPESEGSPTEVDLAVAMCRITRYAGALWCPLAAHSILVAELAFMARNDDRLWAHALLHDVHECVIGEVVRTWKPYEMKAVERAIDQRILRHFGLNLAQHDAYRTLIKDADEKALCAEATILELPGWSDFYRNRNDRDIPFLADSERSVADQILSGLWCRHEMIDVMSRQVAVLRASFLEVRRGKYGAARKLVSPIAILAED